MLWYFRRALLGRGGGLRAWAAVRGAWLRRASRSMLWSVIPDLAHRGDPDPEREGMHALARLGLGLGHSVGTLVWWNGQDLNEFARGEGGDRDPAPRSCRSVRCFGAA